MKRKALKETFEKSKINHIQFYVEKNWFEWRRKAVTLKIGSYILINSEHDLLTTDVA